MAFWDLENSVFGGRPVVLFRFVAGSTVWTYTSTGRDFTYNGELYTAAPIKHENFEVSQDSLKSDLNITMARTLDVVAQYTGYPPENVTYLTVYRIHKGDTEAVICWQGRVTACTRAGDEVTLQCESLRTQIRQTGLVRMSRYCRHSLYGPQCGLVASDWAVRLHGVVSDGSRLLTHADLAGYTDGWWNGGYVSLDSGERRMIVAHSGSSVTLHYALTNVASETTATFYAGCDLTIATCKVKFSNVINFGGAPTIPQDNPFTGDKVA